LGDNRFDQFTRQRMPYEQDRHGTRLTSCGVAWPCDTPAAVDRLADGQFQDVARLEGLRALIPHATIVPSGYRVGFTGYHPALYWGKTLR
jgi:hypothetical protein